MTLRFGIYDHFERRQDVPVAQQFEERLQLLELADQAGVYGYHVAEHHHSPLCLATNQAVYLAAAAQRTKQLRFGTLVYVLPLHHPIRLIEEICLVDQLSNGRYQVGVGPGTGGGTEFVMWGGDPAENRGRFEETLAILRAGLQTDFLTHHGRYYDFQDLWMELRPVQQPHPPFWYAGNADAAARRGMNFIGNGPLPAIAQAVRRFREVWAEEPPAPPMTRPADPLYGGSIRIFIDETDAAAQERAASAWEDYRTHYAKPLPPGGADAQTPDLPETTRRAYQFRDEANHFAMNGGPATLGAREAMARGQLLAGSPETVRAHVRAYVEQTEANYFVGAFQWGDLTHAEAARSLGLFASEVMPAFSRVAV